MQRFVRQDLETSARVKKGQGESEGSMTIYLAHRLVRNLWLKHSLFGNDGLPRINMGKFKAYPGELRDVRPTILDHMCSARIQMMSVGDSMKDSEEARLPCAFHATQYVNTMTVKLFQSHAIGFHADEIDKIESLIIGDTKINPIHVHSYFSTKKKSNYELEYSSIPTPGIMDIMGVQTLTHVCDKCKTEKRCLHCHNDVCLCCYYCAINGNWSLTKVCSAMSADGKPVSFCPAGHRKCRIGFMQMESQQKDVHVFPYCGRCYCKFNYCECGGGVCLMEDDTLENKLDKAYDFMLKTYVDLLQSVIPEYSVIWYDPKFYRPYRTVCPLCSKEFEYMSELMKHISQDIASEDCEAMGGDYFNTTVVNGVRNFCPFCLIKWPEHVLIGNILEHWTTCQEFSYIKNIFTDTYGWNKVDSPSF